jgi:hypothetical protein
MQKINKIIIYKLNIFYKTITFTKQETEKKIVMPKSLTMIYLQSKILIISIKIIKITGAFHSFCSSKIYVRFHDQVDLIKTSLILKRSTIEIYKMKR